MECYGAIGYDVRDRIGEFGGYWTGYYENYEGEKTPGQVIGLSEGQDEGAEYI